MINKSVFVYPPSTLLAKANVGANFNQCLGAAYCIAYLRQEGFAAEVFLTDEPVNVTQCVKRLLGLEPQVVGFTVYDSNYCSCQLIARSLKKAAPDIIILFGGPTPSVQASSILETNAYVDICVRHEGEETCVELLSLLEDNGFDWRKASAHLEKIKGISYRLDNHIKENPGRDIFLANRDAGYYLDKYPSPYLSGLLASPDLGIVTARGCNQHCTYCNCAVISKRIIAAHSPDRVIAELDYIARHSSGGRTTPVDIYDDAFTLLPGRALEICHKIIENKIKLPLSCTTRCDKVDEELLEKMKEAGFKAISFSLESAVPRLLRLIGKVHPPHTKSDPNFEKEIEFIEKLKKFSAYAKKIGIETVSASIMIGLPTETRAEGQQTVDLIRSLGSNLDNYAHNILQILPGTPIFYRHEAYGMKLVKLDNRIHYKTIHNYDAGSIPPAPRSHLYEAAVKQNRLSLKSLALSTANKKTAGFFTRLILWADIISKELIDWLQDNIAVDGMLLQVYSDLASASRFHEDNRHNLYKYIAPNLFHPAFYQAHGKNNTITLIPLGMNNWDNPGEFTIELVNTKTGLLNPGLEIPPLQSICMDREKEDVLQLHCFLAQLSEKDHRAEDLFNAPFTPYISTLCRWENTTPNCHSLEILIVDADSNVRTCWNGTPIGKVGMEFNTLRENLRRLQQDAAKKRGCPNCPKEAECSKCIFPAPLSAGEYCDLKKSGNTTTPAELIRTFDFFKEL